MKISWVSFGEIYKEDGHLTSTRASTRYRVLIPCREMTKRGVPYEIFAVEGPNALVQLDEKITGDIIVISKSHLRATVDFARRMKAKGKFIVVDICDNLFIADGGDILGELVTIADRVTTSTQKLAEFITDHTGKNATVLDDPYEGPLVPPKINFSERLNLLWFGHENNIAPLIDTLPEIETLAKQRPIVLNIVTGPSDSLRTKIDTINSRNQGKLRINHVPWSTHALFAALSRTDIVILPNYQNDEYLAKSPNRVIEALRSGRIVLTNPIPSYQPFLPYIFPYDNFIDEIRDLLATDPNVIARKIVAGQEFIEREFSPSVIGDRWSKFLTNLNNSNNQLSPLVEFGKAKLNLGCGDKILEGYINVDVAPSRAGKKPDVISDIKNLPVFQNNFANEILSVHVIEHFYYWEVPDVLTEWIRILKPGGKLIIECPNLVSAAQEFLKDIEQGARPDESGQRTMWVWYGDPKWRDPLMMHRWAYTPSSLSQLLREVGLVNVRQEPAQFKLREPRDMRIVGEKP